MTQLSASQQLRDAALAFSQAKERQYKRLMSLPLAEWQATAKSLGTPHVSEAASMLAQRELRATS